MDIRDLMELRGLGIEPEETNGRLLIYTPAQAIRWWLGGPAARAVGLLVLSVLAVGTFLIASPGRTQHRPGVTPGPSRVTTSPSGPTTSPSVPDTTAAPVTTATPATVAPPVTAPPATVAPVTAPPATGPAATSPNTVPRTIPPPPPAPKTYSLTVNCPTPVTLSVSGTGVGSNTLTVSGPNGSQSANGTNAHLTIPGPAGRYVLSDTDSGGFPFVSWSGGGASCS